MYINISCNMQDDTIKFSAEELKKYLEKLNKSWMIVINNEGKNEKQNKYLNIVLSVDQILEDKIDDKYTINIEGEEGYIRGNNSRSVLLAIYKFLNLIGFRFLRPGEEYTLIPDVKENDLFLQYESEADFRHRGVCIEGADSRENVLEFIDWLPKVGFNSFFVQFKIPYTFLERWYNHKYNDYILPEGFDFEKAKEMSSEFDEQMEKRSILHHRVGHGWTTSAIGQSDLGWNKVENELTGKFKEFPAMIDGKRDFFHGIPTNTNLCYSNLEVLEVMSNDIVEYSLENPSIDYLHVWLADEYNNICECSECIKTNPTDQYINLLNIIDQKMTEKNMDTKIVFLLYQELLWAPLYEEYKNSERFILMFAPISRTFEKSYGELGEVPEIPEYNRNNITLPISLEENIGFLREWQKVYSGDSFVYDYPLGRAHYGDIGYISISKVISEDIKNLESLSLNGYISCQELRSFLPNGLPNYVMGLTLYDSDLSFEEISKDYFESAYGKYGQDVYLYLEKLSKYSSADYFNGKGPRENKEKADELSKIKGIVDDFSSIIKDQLEKTGGVQRLFWEHLAYHEEYSIILSKALSSLAKGEKEQAQKYWSDFQDYIGKNELNYQKSLDVYRINDIGMKYTGFDPK